MKNNYTIKPNLLRTSFKRIYFDRKKEHLKEMNGLTIRAQIIFLVGSIFAFFGSETLGSLGIIIFIMMVLHNNLVIFNKVTEKKKSIEQQEKAKENDIKTENIQRIDYAKEMSLKLNEILDKSEELRLKGIPFQLDCAHKVLDKIKFEFQENALIPFWDEIENFVIEMNSYQNSLQIMETNKKIYYQIVHSTENNFPKTFPSYVDEKKTENLISEFKTIQREAFKKFEFANLWEQRKTQKILAFGFSNLQDAINNMSYNIVSSINILNDNISTLDKTISNGYENLSKVIRLNNLQDLSNTNRILEDNLKSIDEKLYYIQYNRKPFGPFGDIFASER
jgi:hypothetical protein